MEDEPRSDMIPGLKGTVEGVDDAGNIMVRWDNGSGLSLAYGADSCRKSADSKRMGRNRGRPHGKTLHYRAKSRQKADFSRT